MNTQTFSQMVSSMVTAVQSRATALTNFTAGSVLRAVTEAVSSVGLWLQNLVIQALGYARASTSAGADLDSWMADFGITRLPAVAAFGNATFSRYTTTATAQIPVGSQVQTADGTQTYTAQADTTNPAYNPALSAYVMAVNIASLTVPVVAAAAGSMGNVLANTVTVIYQSLPGVDTVTNPDAILHGVDAETDAALRARYVLYINSLSKGTVMAIESAVAGVQAGLTYTVNENINSSGARDDGYWFVVVDDGSGAPSNTLLSEVRTAVEASRGVCSNRYSVMGPTIETATVSFRIAVVAGYDPGVTQVYAQNAVQSLIAGLGVGDGLLLSSIANAAYTAPGVLGVTEVTINGSADDLAAAVTQVIHAGTITAVYP